MSGICDTCMTAGTCEIRRDGRKLCAAYERNSNYNRLFGTHERAARTLAMFSPLACSYCALYSTCGDDQDKECLLCDCDALLEWLRGESE